jgi:hypothetical protein
MSHGTTGSIGQPTAASNPYQQEISSGANTMYVPPPAAAGDVTSMTPDALMAYCSSRLNSLDGQMKEVFAQQQLGTEEQSLIGGAVSLLQGFEQNGISNDPKTCTQVESQLEALYSKIQRMDPNSPALKTIATVHDELMASGTGPYTDTSGNHGFLGPGPNGYATGHTEQDNTIDGDEMQGYVNQLQGAASSLNSSSELGMINLQSLMTQRQTAIQLTTNLVQTLGDTNQKVVDKIGT